MAVLDGLGATRRLRVAERLQAVHIIAGPASASREHQRASLQAGAHVYLPEPIDPPLLLHHVGKLLSLSWRPALGEPVKR